MGSIAGTSCNAECDFALNILRMTKVCGVLCYDVGLWPSREWEGGFGAHACALLTFGHLSLHAVPFLCNLSYTTESMNYLCYIHILLVTEYVSKNRYLSSDVLIERHARTYVTRSYGYSRSVKYKTLSMFMLMQSVKITYLPFIANVHTSTSIHLLSSRRIEAQNPCYETRKLAITISTQI
jgi:hypothetical protein